MSNKSNRFPFEVRKRTVDMVQEHRGEYPSLWPELGKPGIPFALCWSQHD